MFRNFLFDHNLLKSKEFPIPLISVGNITVGGTGKTPHTEYLARLLQERFRIAVLSRGYMRSSKGFIVATDLSGTKDIGDEPLQMKLKFPGVTVAVDASRRNGIQRILEQFPETDVILLDDAFQHRWIKPGLSIMLTDYNRLFTRDKLLPYGRLREHRYNSRRADIIIVSKVPGNLPASDLGLLEKEISPKANQRLFITSIEYGNLRNIHTGESAGISMNDISSKGSYVLLLTGIANPEPLRKYIEGFTTNISPLNFRDHHRFTTGDLLEIKKVYGSLPKDNRCIITTEKDYIRLREVNELLEILDEYFYYLPVSVGFKNNKEKERFNNHIINYVEKDRRNSLISEG